MKKSKIKGNTLKTVSDPNLAKPHKKGAVVELVQPAKDNKWGRFYVKHYHRHVIIFNDAIDYYNNTEELLKQCRAIALDKTNARHIEDDLRDQLELSSIKYVMLIKLGFEYITTELLGFINNVHIQKGGKVQVQWENLSLLERLKVLLTNLQLTTPIPVKTQTILERRDIVEHPNADRLYNSKEQEWKNVHLSLVLSGEIDGSADEIIPFVQEIMGKFEKFVQDNQIPGTLTGLQRGIKSADQFKK